MEESLGMQGQGQPQPQTNGQAQAHGAQPISAPPQGSSQTQP